MSNDHFMGWRGEAEEDSHWLTRFIYKLANYPFNFERKTRFSVTILNFLDQTGSRFFEPIFLTNYYHRSWKFAIRILKISQLVLKLLAKNRFSAAILNFYDQTGIRIFEPIFFINLYYRTWKFAIKVLKISQLVLKLSAKNRFFGCHFEFFRPYRR